MIVQIGKLEVYMPKNDLSERSYWTLVKIKNKN